MRVINLFFCYLCLCSTFAIASLDPVIKAKTENVNKHKVLGFQENKGQMIDIDSKPANYVLFKAEAPGINIWVTTI